MRYLVRSRPEWGSVKIFVANKERNRGESPYMTMDAADTEPMRLGKFFVAVNNEEKKLEAA